MLAFFLHYVEKGPRESKGDAADFGICVHAALEAVYQWIVQEEYAGIFPVAELVAFYKETWTKSALTGVSLYQEGLLMLRSYAERQGTVDHLRILASEREFNLELGRFVVNGKIDLVERVDDETIEITDFKTNRALFTEDELANDLQMSVYGAVAREFWPWAKRIRFTFDMLRHGARQPTVRTAQELDDAAGYVEALGERSEEPRTREEWRPTLQPLCAYCDSSARCATYQAALAGKEPVTQVRDFEGIEAVAAERQRIATLSDLLFKRKNEFDKVLLARLGKEGPFTAAGVAYRVAPFEELSFPDSERVVRAFVAHAKLPPEEVRARIGADPERVEALRKELEASGRMDRGRAAVLEISLRGLAQVNLTPKWPKLLAQPVKSAAKQRETDRAKEAAIAEKA